MGHSRLQRESEIQLQPSNELLTAAKIVTDTWIASLVGCQQCDETEWDLILLLTPSAD
jgi:hypothetical protein